jgi:hypothetical protein
MAATSAVLWDSAVKYWAAKHGNVQSTADGQAAVLAEKALARCTYLGGLPEYPNRAKTFGLGCIVVEGSWSQVEEFVRSSFPSLRANERVAVRVPRRWPFPETVGCD